MRFDYDIIVIGGGITGAGTARDCAIRGLKVLLVERHDIATGATGRNHGLLHSGFRTLDRNLLCLCAGCNDDLVCAKLTEDSRESGTVGDGDDGVLLARHILLLLCFFFNFLGFFFTKIRMLNRHIFDLDG